MQGFIICLILCLLFLVIGILLSKIIPNSMNSKKLRCTYSVNAVITGEHSETNGSDSGPMYAPIFEYYFNNVLYKQTPKLHTSKRVQVGRQVILYVNPNNPTEIFDPETWGYAQRIFNIIGKAFIASAVFTLILGIILMIVI